jgi:hypothetical protein
LATTGKHFHVYIFATLNSVHQIKEWLLITSDAHGVYKNSGFKPIEMPVL